MEQKSINNILKKNIKKAIKMAGKTQTQVSKEIGLSEKSLNIYLTDKKNERRIEHLVFGIAKACNVDPNFLYGWSKSNKCH